MRVFNHVSEEIAKRLKGDARLKELAFQVESRIGHKLSLNDIIDIQNRFQRRSNI